MAGLSVIFKAVDEISSKFENMATSGTKALDAFELIEETADKALSSVEEGGRKAADAMDQAASATDYWTDAVGNYDKGAMQAVWTTEELVDMGYMTEDALTQAADAMDEAGQAADEAAKDMEDLGDEAKKAGDKSSESMMSLDDVLKTVGIVMAIKSITNAFAECSEAAAEFETSVAMVSTVADTTVLSASELSAQITQLSMETGKGVNGIADATYNAISAGIATENAVATVREASKLATAGFTSESSALSVLTTALNAYQMEASEVTNISDSLVTSQNLGVLTIDQMASSMGKAISTASAYNVNLYNLESSYISLTKAGISVEESTTYVSSMMNELGKSSSGVAKILQEETGMSFGQMMEQGYSLADVLGVLYDSVNQDSEAFMNLWGSAEAGKAGNAIINQGLETFNTNLGKLANSAGTTQKAYEAMTDTTAHSTERMKNSFENLSIAIGDDLNPIVSAFQNGIASVTDRFTALITKYPAISAMLTGMTVALAALTIGLGGYTIAQKAATVATAAWTAVMNMNPVFLAITAVTALTAGLVALAVVMAENTEDTERLTAASRAQAEELEELNAEYERTVELYGKNSDEAIALERDIDNLTAEYEASRQTMEEYREAFQGTMDAYTDMTDRHQEQEASMKHEGAAIGYMVNRLEELASQTDLTAGEQQEMLSIIESLNEEVPGLSLSYDELTGSLSETSEAIRKLAEAEVATRQYEEYNDQLIEKLSMSSRLEEEKTRALEEQAAALAAVERAEYDLAAAEQYAQAKWPGATPNGAEATLRYNYLLSFQEALEDAEDEYEEFTENAEDATAALEENEAEITRISEEMARLVGATEEAVEASDGYNEAVSAIGEYQEEIVKLCDAYDAAYEAAVSSIEGQYSLWDKADEVVATSRENIEGALQSQIDYWTAYNDNLSSLTAKADDIAGLSDMLADLSDGSSDSAAMLAGLKGLSDEELAAVVEQYNTLKKEQTETAQSIAELQTDFSEKMSEIEDDMKAMVDGMDLSEEAKKNGKSTIDAYVSEIESGVARAQSAIDSLDFANNTVSKGGYHAYAEGTLDAAPGLALVGEEGPELVNFGGGEVVYTAPETAEILTRSGGERDFNVTPPEDAEEKGTSVDKTVTLRIEGAGEMKVAGNGVSKEEVVNVLMDNVKGVLMGILQNEILEEGDLAYEF